MPYGHPPEVVGVSATQIDTYLLCNKKWGWEKLDGYPRPQNKFAKRGSGVHGVIEGWLDKGTPIDPTSEYGSIAYPGIRFLPKPGEGLIEHEFQIRTTDGIRYNGKIDIWQPWNGEVIRVWDHKTTTDLKWAKKPFELAKDPQAMLYGSAAKVLNKGIEVPIELNWVYYRASGKPGARKVTLRVVPGAQEELLDKKVGTISHERMQAEWDRFHEVALELREHRLSGRKTEDLEANISACHKFGGCPFRGNPCRITPRQHLRGIMAQADASALLAKARAAKAAAGGTTTSAASTPSAESQASPETKAEVAEHKVATATEAAQVNPPEEPKGGPATRKTTESRPTVSIERAMMAATVASGIIARGGVTDPKKVAQEAVKVTDAILEVL